MEIREMAVWPKTFVPGWMLTTLSYVGANTAWIMYFSMESVWDKMHIHVHCSALNPFSARPLQGSG